MNQSSLLEPELRMLIACQGPPRPIGLLDWDLSRYLPFGIDRAQIRYMSAINRDLVDCPEEPGSAMVATSFWNTLTANLAAEMKGYVVDAMKVGLIICLEFTEGCGKTEGERHSKCREAFEMVRRSVQTTLFTSHWGLGVE